MGSTRKARRDRFRFFERQGNYKDSVPTADMCIAQNGSELANLVAEKLKKRNLSVSLAEDLHQKV